MARRNQNGFVYVARAQVSGLVKIGFSVDVATRLRSLRSSVGEPVELVAVVRGDVALEQSLLRRVARHSVSVKGNREWHRPTADIDALVASLPPASAPAVAVATGPARKNAPRRPADVIAAERRHLADEAAARRLDRHQHGPGRVESCALCRKELAQMATWRSKGRHSSPLQSAVAAACAKAPTLTGGA